jgi:hypothetical protein
MLSAKRKEQKKKTSKDQNEKNIQTKRESKENDLLVSFFTFRGTLK